MNPLFQSDCGFSEFIRANKIWLSQSVTDTEESADDDVDDTPAETKQRL
jgi:hypothetical protein